MARQGCSIVYAADGCHIFDYRDEAYGLYLILGSGAKLLTASNSFSKIVEYMENHPNPYYSVIDWRASRWIIENGKYV